MKNAAGDKNCDEYLRKELEVAGLVPTEMPCILNGEVPTKLVAFHLGWTFKRAWYYWMAKTEKNPLLFEYAEPLHEKYGRDVRVDGHCGCPSPREWFKEKWELGVNHYHIDSEWGLRALVDAINLQAEIIKSALAGKEV